jgi:hypothetical protein
VACLPDIETLTIEDITMWKLLSMTLVFGSAQLTTAQVVRIAQDRTNNLCYEKVRLGMSFKQVKSLLGNPTDAYIPVTRARGVQRELLDSKEEGKFEPRPDDNERGRRWLWSGQDTVMLIRVNVNNRVTDKLLMRLQPLGFWERIQDSVLQALQTSQ